MNKQLLDASTRVALAAYLHDLGKFAERARIEVSEEKLEMHRQLYCRRNPGKNGGFWYSHTHAAYTGLAMEMLEAHMPALKGADFYPFGSMHSQAKADDSLVNASSMHHRPENFLQWIVATADRAASGFEREEFDRYNDAEEGTDTGKNHYQARMVSLLEQIKLEKSVPVTPDSLKFRYPLLPLSPVGIFPVLREKCEPSDDKQAQHEYRCLWEGFVAALEKIPTSHREQLPLWLDHFDTLWLTFTHAIPSATAGKTRPEVSLYDHSKAAASLATALWRYHADQDHDTAAVTKAMASRADWDDKKFLLVQGDFHGIQDFIFAHGAETNKKAAKVLRGRSFYVSLLAEMAALRLLEEMDLPSTSQVTNAAGKFLLVAPNTAQAREAIAKVSQMLDSWFLDNTYGRSGIGLAVEEASCNDFVSRGENGFKALMRRLFEKLEIAKYRQFGLCATNPVPAVFEGYLDSFDNTLGVCSIDQQVPARTRDGEMAVSLLAGDYILLGEHLTKRERLLVTTEKLSENRYSLKVPIFGYWVHMTGSEADTGKFGECARDGQLRRAFDFSIPAGSDSPLWNGYSRRNINGYVPEFSDTDLLYPEKYSGINEKAEVGVLKTLNHIACENRKPASGGNTDKWVGIRAIGTLKGDVDNLGSIFQKGLESPTFAKMASLSRQVNNFFAVYLPWLCRSEFPNTYTVFAGGDDFFLIGPWRSQFKLASRLSKQFAVYCSMNPELHFSAGMTVTKPGLPVNYLGRSGEDALEQAKQFSDAQAGSKNALHLFGQTVPWAKVDELLQACTTLETHVDNYNLSTAYVYALLNLLPMVEDPSRPENHMWRSRLTYKTWRTLQQRKLAREDIQAIHARLMKDLGEQGLQKWGGAYRVALQNYIYQNR